MRNILLWLGLIQSEEEKRILRLWKYAQENYGARITDFGYGRWNLTLDPEKVRKSKEFQDALEKAEKIVNTD